MQRPSSQQRREDSSQFQQQLEAEAAIHKLVGGEASHQQREIPSRPVSPLIAPNVKARPSSVVLDNITGSSNQATNNTIVTDNPNPHSIDLGKDSDSPPQSPITFLDSGGPLIQTQDPEPSLVENLIPTQSNNTTSGIPPNSSASTYWSSALGVPASTASQSAVSAVNHTAARSDSHTSSIPTSTSPAFSQQRSHIKSPPSLSTTTSSTNTNRSENTVNTGVTPSSATTERFTPTGYLAQTYQPRPSKPPNSPTSAKEEKKKKNWFGISWGSKETSTSPTIGSSSQQPQLHQKTGNSSKSKNQQQQSPSHQQPLSQQPIQPQSANNKGATSQRGQPALQPSSSQHPPAPQKLQKKKKSRLIEKKQQQVYQNPRANNNSPEPSIISKLTNEELDQEDNSSDLTESTLDNITTPKPRSGLPDLSETPVDSPLRQSLEQFEPDLEEPSKPTSSQSQQTEIAESNTLPTTWEARLHQGQGYQQRQASNDEAFTLQSAGASAQTQRAELKYRDERYGASSRPPSRQSIESPSPSEATSSNIVHQRSSSAQNTAQSKLYMGGSSGQQHPSGRNGELQNSSSNREGQYGSTLSVNNQQQPGSYRNTPQASPMVQDTSSGAGRTTPPPGVGASKSREDLGNMDAQQLATKHDELNEKYRKVKKYYFDKDAQVQQLQNQLAHQRLAQSRTNLDDNEYMTRFARLDGAINNLAFNIRKDWRAVPSWLSHCVNKDATTIVTKEMTAVGRACISRWLVDEVFDRYFHPGLEPHLSCQLKVIEKNIRRFLPPPTMDEEKEALVAKMSNWRLSTLDGLKNVLESEESKHYRDELTRMLVVMLTEDLRDNLKDPPPPGLDAGVIGIIELAVGLAANIPYESRDIFVDYLMPGNPVNEITMKVEAALPALTNPGDGPNEPERLSIDSGDDRLDDNEFGKDGNGKKKGILGGLMGSGGGSRGKQQDSSYAKDQSVRFAAFMVVEVRGGKAVLVKAPVYV